MTITKLQLQKADAAMINIFIDGKFTFALPDTAVYDYSLKTGVEIPGSVYEELSALAKKIRAKRRALNLLSYRPHSRAELKRKLISGGVDRETAEGAASYLEDKGYIDNPAYAKMLSRHLASKYYADGRIAFELKAKGIGREDIGQALLALPDEGERVRAFAERKPSRSPEEQKKLYAALQRRGFSYETIKNALGGLFSFEEED